jgi:transcriptional regulator with XRE-family HTH domain
MTESRTIVQAAVAWFNGNQALLARELGVTRTTVSRWVSGQAVPDALSCLRLAKITGRSAAEVFSAAGLDPGLLPSEPAVRVAETELGWHVRQWLRSVNGLPLTERAIAVAIVDDTVKSVSKRLADVAERASDKDSSAG